MTDDVNAICAKLDSIDKSLALIADALAQLPIYRDVNGSYLRVKTVE